MTIRSQGRKKSLFPGIDGIPAGSTFDFVSGGVNYKIPTIDLLAAFNVTGVIKQGGDPLAVPVLDVQGAENIIRNLEMSGTSGLKGSVSALNGITLSMDAHAAGAGTPVLNADNHIRRILAGAGITVTLVDEDISIAVTGAGPVAVPATRTAGIVASTTQSQGEQPLTTRIAEIATVANANDVVTLPDAAGDVRMISVINNGANTLQIFPPSGQEIDGGGVNVSSSAAPGANVTFAAYDGTNWEAV